MFLERVTGRNQANGGQREYAEVFLLLDILTGCQRYAELDNGSAQECSILQVGQIIFTDSKVERPNRSSVVGTLLDYVDAEDGQEHEIWCDSRSQVLHPGD